MKNLYAPWRSDYTTSEAHSKDENANAKECIFCSQPQDNVDRKNFILKRFSHNYVMLNRYPYNAGHVLIIPFAHVAELEKLDPAVRAELFEAATTSVAILKKALKAQGCNIGLNLGRAAGAGIPSHLHLHVVPRWIGDTNFMPTVCDTKPISFDMTEIYTILQKQFAAL